MAPRSGSHPYRKLVLPKDAAFELRPTTGSPPSKGWGAFATRDIKKGEMVLEDPSIFFVAKKAHQITAKDIDNVMARLSESQRQQLELLCLNGERTKMWANETATFDEVVFQSMLIKEDTSGKFLGTGCHIVSSRFNHSCQPNVRRVHDHESNCSFTSSDSACDRLDALQDIPAGTELTVSYMDGSTGLECLTRAQRHNDLGMVCHCDLCSAGAAAIAVSDARRHKIRELNYLIVGGDVAGTKDHPLDVTTLVSDPKLRDPMNLLGIPLPTKFVYCCQALALVEAEKALRPALVDRFESLIKDFIGFMRGTENQQICEKVLKDKKTWDERFELAKELLKDSKGAGRKDRRPENRGSDAMPDFIANMITRLEFKRANGIPTGMDLMDGMFDGESQGS